MQHQTNSILHSNIKVGLPILILQDAAPKQITFYIPKSKLVYQIKFEVMKTLFLEVVFLKTNKYTKPTQSYVKLKISIK